MKHIFSALFSAFFLLPALAAAQAPQALNYSEHIAPIVYAHCTPCHRAGEVAPFPLTSYQEVASHGQTIKFVTGIRYMPPWKADPQYTHFLDENTLTTAQIQQIRDWVDGGMPQGNPALEPALPTFPSGSQLGTPDLVVPMAQRFTHQGNMQDMYRVFVLPTRLAQTREVAAVEFRAGNKRITHHAILGQDTTQRGQQWDAADPGYGYTRFGGFGFSPTEDNWAGWVPGARARFYPAGLGKKLYKNSSILVQVHYGPTALTQTDSSVVNVFFSRQPVQRTVQTFPLTPLQLVNGPFVLPANTVKMFRAELAVPIDVSLVSVLPHAHLLGKSWKIWALKPNGDTIRLLKINSWDFNWQGAYRFPSLLKIPAGSRLVAEGTYDNTSSNPRNPFFPPQTITWGEATTAEMFVVYFDIVPYRPGDESIVLSAQSERELLRRPESKLYPIYPNPASRGPVTVGFALAGAEPVTLTLTDLQGRVVRRLEQGRRFGAGPHEVPVTTDNLPAGLYLLQLQTPTFRQTQKLVLTR
ncbi:T9SS type A sorting domain-containing protein [Hymenobacter metallilatus]|uniref:T9SS C-terminal target domain-containing protein n=1 Tax=Hymenobacter metallilatus TaxID=2493666 RepID=A0A3R9M3U1_9BACT|nr:T9SS type A sorting domain-containing protein [Hymenobacter metallilatus]RSK36010.1 T9SS C-terminal target domain-containing protein [Hymenobacter metallilatus]